MGRAMFEALRGTGLVSLKTGSGTSEVVCGMQEGVGVRLGVPGVPWTKEHVLERAVEG